ncbi:tetraacyldisaccharide 4'-kinase [Muricauda sp. JGD-17]|uniref:Tetraacyldisaccharide 4'-kinase n=1 Tax=Flagellimonas ochracea TaxID=2696472 RepID=A0A964TEJ0_9FLAO|nr:tetraacyldisaccharide 4'-kinase [Allomuricauda ochracea]NAY92493.1 tetraacyldisaccharide 4'-kinase [Allomuricauda ochracea]
MQRLLRLLAFPISIIYGLVVHIRNFLFDSGVLRSVTFDTPLICVGNLSVGGTGKTPMIEFLVRMLGENKVAILSRGYKRKSKGFVLAKSYHTVHDLGDEPFQLYRKFPNVIVAVDADRRNGITQLESKVQPDIILLDDAFQHRQVKPRFSILLTAFDSLYEDDWYLPTGDLRDSKREASRADLIIVTKSPENISTTKRKEITKKFNPKPRQKVLFAHLAYAEVVKSSGSEQLPLSALKNANIALVTGIARPEPLVKFLKSKGLDFKHFKFRDHHDFSERDIESFNNYEIVLTTEKDYVRLMGRLQNLYYLEIAHRFDTDKDRAILESSIKEIL